MLKLSDAIKKRVEDKKKSELIKTKLLNLKQNMAKQFIASDSRRLSSVGDSSGRRPVSPDSAHSRSHLDENE